MADDSHEVDWWIELPHRFAGLGGRRAVIHGQESKLFTPASRRYVESLVGPSVPVIAIPQAQHHLMLDQPIAFAAAIGAVASAWSAA